MSNLLRLPLGVLASIYGVVMRARNYLYDKNYFSSYRSSLPIISIGNITAGGNGKTPLTLFLAHELSVRGKAPVILSRGYGGKLRGPKLVESTDSPLSVGDEPLMLRRENAAPVVVAKDRVAGVKFIEAGKLGNIIILDDGFQHRRLWRDLDIIAVESGSDEAEKSFLAAELLPLGMFREPREAALKRADIVVFTERSLVSERELKRSLSDLVPRSVQIFRAKMEVQGLFDLSGARVEKLDHLVAFSAIAKPEGFLRTLRALNLAPAEFFPFPDHHIFSMRELESIANRYPASTLVCTAKDAVKLGEFSDEIKRRIVVLKAGIGVIPKDAFVVQVLKRIVDPINKSDVSKVRKLEGR